MPLRRPRVTMTEASGVPVVNVRDDGACRVALHFRVGAADESVLTSGITHAVEHLSLYPLGQRAYGYNGVVGTIRTTFMATGTTREVTDHFATLSSHLRTVPVERFDAEVRILTNEIEARPWSTQAHHYRLRYGFQGPGLSAPLNIGLARVAAADVQAWASRWFTGGNAAVVVIGPKPLNLELDLEPGARQPVSLPPELVTTPVWARGAPTTVNASFALPRTFDSTAALGALTKRLQGRLRYDLGLSYDVGSVYEPVSADSALAMVWASCLAKDADRVQGELSALLGDVRRSGPTPSELTEYQEFFDRMTDDPQGLQADADRRVLEALLGVPVPSDTEYRRELHAITPSSAAAVLDAAAERAILTIPEGAPAPRGSWSDYPRLGYHPSPDLDADIRAGMAFEHRLEPRLSFRRKHPQLIVGRNGLALVEPDGGGYVLRYDELAALVLELDGGASLVDARGFSFTVSAELFKDADRAVRQIEAAFPADRIVRRAP